MRMIPKKYEKKIKWQNLILAKYSTILAQESEELSIESSLLKQ